MGWFSIRFKTVSDPATHTHLERVYLPCRVYHTVEFTLCSLWMCCLLWGLGVGLLLLGSLRDRLPCKAAFCVGSVCTSLAAALQLFGPLPKQEYVSALYAKMAPHDKLAETELHRAPFGLWAGTDLHCVQFGLWAFLPHVALPG